MPEISLGNILTQNGRTTAGGVSSGLDSASLIEGILSAKATRITEIEDKIELTKNKLTALADIKSLLLTLKDAANKLRNPPGVNNDASNLFQYREATVTSSDSVNYLNVSASPGARVNNYQFSNVNIAKAHSISLSGFSSKTDSVVGNASITDDYSASTDATQTVLDTDTPITFSNDIVSGSEGTQASINVIFSADDEFDAADSLTFGSTTLTFGGLGGDDIGLGGQNSLDKKLRTIANYMNSKTTGEEAGYTYTVEDGGSGVDRIVVTRNVVGATASVDNSLNIDSDFSSGSTNQTVQIGDVAATNGASSGFVYLNGTDGTDPTYVSDENTDNVSSLSGAITIGATPTITPGSAPDANSFTANTITFTATIGGETYTSTPIELANGSLDRNTNGSGDNGGGISDNGFGNRIPAGTVITFVKDTQSDPGDPDTRDITFSLTLGSSDVTIDSQADANTLASDIQSHLDTDNVTVSNAGLAFRTGTFTLGGVSIGLEEGDNLNEIVSKINTVSSSSGVYAEILEVSPGSYSLLLNSTQTGADNAIAEYSGGEIVFGHDSISFTEVIAAEDASFDLNGTTFTRATNSISDAIENLTITLTKDTPGAETIDVDITNDTTTTQNGIIDFLNAYNSLKTTLADLTERDEGSGGFTEDAFLGGESIVREVTGSITTELNRLVSGLTGDVPKTIFNLGVSFTDYEGDEETPAVTNIFELDAGELESQLSGSFDDVRKVFETSFTSDSPYLNLFGRTNDLAITDFIFDIDTSRGTADQVRVLDADTNEFLFNATLNSSLGSITGQEGTALEGTTFVYTGDGTETIDVTITQGIADRVFNKVDSILESVTGALDTTEEGFISARDRAEENLEQANNEIEKERERLIAKFSALESVIESFNNTIAFLEAQRKAFEK